MLISLLRLLVLYPIVIFGIRLMGKRQIGELQPGELVITILISNIATLPIEDQDLPLLSGIIPMLTLIAAEVLFSWLTLRHRGLRRLLSGTPQVIIRGGKIDQKVMRTLRFSLDDLMTALRTNGIFDLNEVQLAIVETNGTVSVYPHADYRTPTCADLKLRLPDAPPPEVLISDGCLCTEGMQAAGYSEKRLQKLLKSHNVAASEVFLLTADRSGAVTLIKREAMP